MKLSTPAKYFDGKTSRPYLLDLEVFLGEQISYYFENKRSVWKFQDIKFEKIGDHLVVTRKDNLSESLKIENPEVANTIYSSAKKSKNVSWYHTLLDLGPKFYITATVATFTLIACFYIFIIPWVGEKVTDLMPLSFDEEIGDSSFQQIKSFSNIDEKRSAKLQNFADHIDFGTHRKLNFKVIDDKEINAFALPNGTIVVYTGLLSKIENYEELAALLGHEVTHVKERHSTKTLARSLAGYLVVSVVVGDVNGVMTSLADNANQLNNLSFSRAFESSSDLGSYEILKKNKIDPDGMYQLFKTLKINHDGEIPELLSSHPLTDDRIKFSKSLLDRQEYSFEKNPKLENAFKRLKENH